MQRRTLLGIVLVVCFVRPTKAGWPSYLQGLFGGEESPLAPPENDAARRRRMQTVSNMIRMCSTSCSCSTPSCWTCPHCRPIKQRKVADVKESVPSFNCRFDKSGKWNYWSGYCGDRSARKIGGIMICGSLFVAWCLVPEIARKEKLLWVGIFGSLVLFLICFPIAGVTGTFIMMVPCMAMWLLCCVGHLDDPTPSCDDDDNCCKSKGSSSYKSNSYGNNNYGNSYGNNRQVAMVSSSNTTSTPSYNNTYGQNVGTNWQAQTWNSNPVDRQFANGPAYGGPQWPCPRCTYLNPSQGSFCFQCQTAKPDNMCVLATSAPTSPPTVQGGQVQNTQPTFNRYHNMTHSTVTMTAQEYTSTSQCYSGGGQTTYLDLHYNDIASLQLSRWPNLVKLNLESNGLPRLNGMLQCQKLQWIDVGNNDLGPIDGINGLTQLIYFSAKKNGITRVSLNNLPSLEYFDVTCNDIKTVNGFGNCPNLRHVYLDENYLDENSIVNVTSEITNCRGLQEVRLRKNDFSAYGNNQISQHYSRFSHVNIYLTWDVN